MATWSGLVISAIWVKCIYFRLLPDLRHKVIISQMLTKNTVFFSDDIFLHIQCLVTRDNSEQRTKKIDARANTAA